MAICMVGDQSIPEPADFFNTKRLLHAMLELGLRQVNIAVGVENTLPGRNQLARSIAIDRAAFQYPVLIADRQVKPLCQPLTNILITGHFIFSAPAVEAKVPAIEPAGTRDKNRRAVAQPDIPEGFNNKIYAGLSQRSGDILISRIAAHQNNRLASAVIGNRIGKGRNFALGGFPSRRPFRRIAGKADPHRLMRFPFCWPSHHPVSDRNQLPARLSSRVARNSSPSFQLGQSSVIASIRATV